MPGEIAQLTILGPFGLLLGGAVVIGVLAAAFWRGRTRPDSDDALAELFEGDTLQDHASDPILRDIRPRGIRRSTRGPRPYDPGEQDRMRREIAAENRRIERGYDAAERAHATPKNDCRRARFRNRARARPSGRPIGPLHCAQIGRGYARYARGKTSPSHPAL